MDTHGTQLFTILGEGVVGGVLDGTDDDSATSAAAANATPSTTADVEPPAPERASADPTPRAAEAAAVATFRFSRLGPKGGGGRQLSRANLRNIAVEMTRTGVGFSNVPAGYTYLGQFVDHDLTMDRTSVMLADRVSPAKLLQGRSPSLDLDSLYGAGPTEPGSARFYADDGVHLKVGRTVDDIGEPPLDGFDLPRRVKATTDRARRRALIPDRRNDENLAVAQTHLAMIRFHNRVVDTLPSSTPAAQRFATARELVTKHYQWMIRTDYLPRICDPVTLDDVFVNGRKVFEVSAAPTDVPTMPIEFSVAAYRLGHSMVRGSYRWNRIFDDDSGTLDLLFEFSGTSGTLGGHRRLPSSWVADFRRLYDFAEAGRDNLTVPKPKFNRAKRIDTRLANPLRNLPRGSFGGPRVGFDDPIANLAFRNLMRARMVRLATGQQMAELMAARGMAITPLTRSQIRNGDAGVELDGLARAQRRALVRNTPLWFYILREAELHGGRLHGVGARIVAETFQRALEGSEASIVRDPAFRPTLGPDDQTFRMVDLLLFAFDGRKRLLAPLG